MTAIIENLADRSYVPVSPVALATEPLRPLNTGVNGGGDCDGDCGQDDCDCPSGDCEDN